MNGAALAFRLRLLATGSAVAAAVCMFGAVVVDRWMLALIVLGIIGAAVAAAVEMLFIVVELNPEVKITLDTEGEPDRAS